MASKPIAINRTVKAAPSMTNDRPNPTLLRGSGVNEQDYTQLLTDAAENATNPGAIHAAPSRRQLSNQLDQSDRYAAGCYRPNGRYAGVPNGSHDRAYDALSVPRIGVIAKSGPVATLTSVKREAWLKTPEKTPRKRSTKLSQIEESLKRVTTARPGDDSACHALDVPHIGVTAKLGNLATVASVKSETGLKTIEKTPRKPSTKLSQIEQSLKRVISIDNAISSPPCRSLLPCCSKVKTEPLRATPEVYRSTCFVRLPPLKTEGASPCAIGDSHAFSLQTGSRCDASPEKTTDARKKALSYEDNAEVDRIGVAERHNDVAVVPPKKGKKKQQKRQHKMGKREEEQVGVHLSNWHSSGTLNIGNKIVGAPCPDTIVTQFAASLKWLEESTRALPMRSGAEARSELVRVGEQCRDALNDFLRDHGSEPEQAIGSTASNDSPLSVPKRTSRCENAPTLSRSRRNCLAVPPSESTRGLRRAGRSPRKSCSYRMSSTSSSSSATEGSPSRDHTRRRNRSKRGGGSRSHDRRRCRGPQAPRRRSRSRSVIRVLNRCRNTLASLSPARHSVSRTPQSPPRRRRFSRSSSHSSLSPRRRGRSRSRHSPKRRTGRKRPVVNMTSPSAIRQQKRAKYMVVKSSDSDEEDEEQRIVSAIRQQKRVKYMVMKSSDSDEEEQRIVVTKNSP